MRILAVDPGEKRFGLALSDPSGTIASPLTTLKHIARAVDAAAIAQIAAENGAALIVIGQALDDEGQPTPQSRKADRLAEAIRQQTSLPVQLWDESGSTQAARSASIAMGVSARKRRRQGHGHLDELAAVVILQDYLDRISHE
jgi:putative Holliday junction resolvase